MLGGGTISVRTSVLIPDASVLAQHPGLREDRYVCICLEDDGTGIAPEVLPHIFEPFFTTKELGRGTGLGLAMVYGFVKQSGGYVYAENRPEGGARFSVYLPVATGEDGKREEASPARPSAIGGSELILLVEDEAGVLAYGRSLLERSGYGVLAVSGAAEALGLDPRRLEEVSLLITDVVMPGMNGKALADALQCRRPGLKVLFTSGYAEEIFTRFGISPGELSLLQKPYAGSELLCRVREILDT
jgi:CheY-like chemotaxis protein